MFELRALGDDLLVGMKDLRCTARLFGQSKNRLGDTSQLVDQHRLNGNVRLHVEIGQELNKAISLSLSLSLLLEGHLRKNVIAGRDTQRGFPWCCVS